MTKDKIEERIYKSLWHIFIAGVGFYEIRNHKTKVSKVLACGLIAFHIDAAISDIVDCDPLSRKLLEKVLRMNIKYSKLKLKKTITDSTNI